METLQQIARQTRKPIEFFLDQDASPSLDERQTKLRELERLSAGRDLEKVLEMGNALLERQWSAEDAAVIHFSLGQAYCRLVKPTDALPHLRIALGEFEGMDDVAHSWMLAVRYYDAAVAAATGVKDLLQLAKMHHGLGRAYQSMQQPSTARQHYDKALALYSIESDLSSVDRDENDLGDLMLEQGQLDSAEEHMLKAR